LKGLLPQAAPGVAPTPEEQDKELAVLLFAGRYMFDRWFAEEADTGAPAPRIPRAWNRLSQADFDRLNEEVADKLQAFRERHQVIVDVDALAVALKRDDRPAGQKVLGFAWREGWAGIVGAAATVLFVVLLTLAYSALGGQSLARDVLRFLTEPPREHTGAPPLTGHPEQKVGG
jgi:hypothetical protein